MQYHIDDVLNDPQFGSQFSDPDEIVQIQVPVLDQRGQETSALYPVSYRASELPGFNGEIVPGDRNQRQVTDGEIPTSMDPYEPDSFFNKNFGGIAGAFMGGISGSPLVGGLVGGGISAISGDNRDRILGSTLAGAGAGYLSPGVAGMADGGAAVAGGEASMGSDAASLAAAEQAAGIPTAAEVGGVSGSMGMGSDAASLANAEAIANGAGVTADGVAISDAAVASSLGDYALDAAKYGVKAYLNSQTGQGQQPRIGGDNITINTADDSDRQLLGILPLIDFYQRKNFIG